MNDPATALRLSGLSAGYGRMEVLRGVDLELRAGEVAGLVGPNGVGKSTLLRVLCNELRPSGGEMLLPPPGEDGAPGLLRLPQEPDLPPFLSLMEMVALGARAWRPGADPAAEAEAGLARWGLGGRMDRPIRLASPGELRRALLALAEIARPRVLLLDEVLSALDPAVLVEAEVLLRELASGGTATLIVSHDLGLAERIPDRVALLYDGRIARVWAREQIESARRDGRSLLDLYLEGVKAT